MRKYRFFDFKSIKLDKKSTLGVHFTKARKVWSIYVKNEKDAHLADLAWTNGVKLENYET